MSPSLIELLTIAIDKNASDLHLSSGVAPSIRIDGELKWLGADPIEVSTLQPLLESLLNDIQNVEFNLKGDIDFSLELSDLSRFRVNLFRHQQGIAGAFRIIPSTLLTLEQLGHPPVMKAICNHTSGLVLVTGQTGSGKSTTLAAMINYLNETTASHIVTIEDPIEFIHPCKKSLVHQREVKRDTSGFNQGLYAALREDPDYIMVGELRCLDTIRMALTAAETGHLVFASLHTSSAAKSINRMIDVFPNEEKSVMRTILSESLQAIVCQSLIPKIGGGRVAALEILRATPAIRNLIRENKVAQIVSAIQLGARLGMQTLEQHLQQLLEKSLIHPSYAQLSSMDKNDF